jgi:hypothetical protein
MKQKYSLYELIKDKLSPVTRQKLEYQMRYKEAVKQAKNDEYRMKFEKGE